MIKLDENLLVELGLGNLPKEEKTAFLRHMYETLEMRVGTRLAERMSQQQMTEFEQFITTNDEQGAFQWLERNFPNYRDVVAEEFEKLKGEVRPLAGQISSASQVQAAAGSQPAGQQFAPGPAAYQPPTQQSGGSVQLPQYGGMPPASDYQAPPSPTPVPFTPPSMAPNGPNNGSQLQPEPQREGEQPFGHPVNASEPQLFGPHAVQPAPHVVQPAPPGPAAYPPAYPDNGVGGQSNFGGSQQPQSQQPPFHSPQQPAPASPLPPQPPSSQYGYQQPTPASHSPQQYAGQGMAGQPDAGYYQPTQQPQPPQPPASNPNPNPWGQQPPANGNGYGAHNPHNPADDHQS